MGRKHRNTKNSKIQIRKGKKLPMGLYPGITTLAEAEEMQNASIIEIRKEPPTPAVLENIAVAQSPDTAEEPEPARTLQPIILSDTDTETTVETRDIVALVGFLIGVKRDFLEQHYSDCSATFDRLKDNREAKIIRYLCKIRTTLFQKTGNVDRELKYELKNLDRQDIFDAENIKELENLGRLIPKKLLPCSVVKKNAIERSRLYAGLSCSRRK